MARGKIIGGLENNTRTRFDLLKIVYEAYIDKPASYDMFINYLMNLYECIDSTMICIIRLYHTDRVFKQGLYTFYKIYVDEMKQSE